jgi:hypothetical protein
MAPDIFMIALRVLAVLYLCILLCNVFGLICAKNSFHNEHNKNVISFYDIGLYSRPIFGGIF